MTSAGRDAGPVMKVEAGSLTYVKPNKMLGRKQVQLNSFDIRFLQTQYIQFMMVYRSIGDFDDVEEKMKNGLRAVLEDYFPLAGKMVKDEDGILRLEYDDDMDGAELKIAFAVDVYVDDLMEGNRVHKFKEFFPYNDVFNIEGLIRPLLSVQVTKLKDGFALGCALNHTVVDGMSTLHFLSAWAATCSGSTHISVKPFHDRAKARNTLVKIHIPSTSQDDRGFITMPCPPVAQRIFSFSSLTVDKIVSNTNEHQTNGKRFSTFQCMAAHVWHAVTRARRLNHDDITATFVVANTRSRIDPPMPESYFGNLITVAHTSMTSGDLLTSPPGTPASIIQKAIEMHDSNSIDRAMKEWESDATTAFNPTLPFVPTDYGNNPVWFGGSPRLKLYELDFGWGIPEKVWCGVNNRHDGQVFFFQGSHGDRSIDIDINLEDNAMMRLELDKEFLMQDSL